jgi:adenylate cyclase class 1
LQEKLKGIERWAKERFDLDVHFFLCDIAQVRDNRFGHIASESSGSTQSVFLKSEFYTTHILIAGKAPIWWLMPETVTNDQYNQLINHFASMSYPNPAWFIDLGNIERLDPNELFGAAIWQISKGITSPFKSVLKLAQLEVNLHNLERLPLCIKMKKVVMRGINNRKLPEFYDPYALLFDELVEYYLTDNDRDTLELLRLCLYIKCSWHSGAPHPIQYPDFKQLIMEHYLIDWSWTDAEKKQLDQLRFWDHLQLISLSQKVHRFLLTCYRRMSHKFSLFSHNVSRRDMTIIGRKLEVYYASKDHKITYMRNVFDEEFYCQEISLRPIQLSKQKSQWEIYVGHYIGCEASEQTQKMLFQDSDPIRLLLRAHWNGMIDAETKIQVIDDNSELKSDLQQILPLFSLISPNSLSSASPTKLLKPSQICSCLVVINLFKGRQKPSLSDCRILAATSWGECFFYQSLEQFAQVLISNPLPKISEQSVTILMPRQADSHAVEQIFGKEVTIDYIYWQTANT